MGTADHIVLQYQAYTAVSSLCIRSLASCKLHSPDQTVLQYQALTADQTVLQYQAVTADQTVLQYQAFTADQTVLQYQAYTRYLESLSDFTLIL